jgi:four helix bundle protein
VRRETRYIRAVDKLPYRDLIVWQRSRALASRVFDIAESPSFRTRFFYRDQMCRAAMSVPANVAEGNGRSTPLDYASFVVRAHGSLFELDTWLVVAADRGWVNAADWGEIKDEIGQISAMLNALATRLRSKPTLESRQP